MTQIIGYNKETLKKYKTNAKESLYYKTIIEIKSNKILNDQDEWWNSVLNALKGISEIVEEEIKEVKNHV